MAICIRKRTVAYMTSTDMNGVGDILFIISYSFVVVILFLFERRKPKGGYCHAQIDIHGVTREGFRHFQQNTAGVQPEESVVSYPDPRPSSGWITSPLCGSRVWRISKIVASGMQ